MRLAVRQINDRGGIRGSRIELAEYDDASNPSEAVTAATRLGADPSIVAACAHYNSGCALASNEIFHRYGLVNLVPGAVNKDITGKRGFPEIFRIIPTDVLQMQYAASFAVNEVGSKRFYLVHDNTTYGISLITLFDSALTSAAASVVGKDAINVGERDYRALVEKIKNAHPDHIFFGGVATEAALLVSQLRDAGVSVTFQSGTGILSDTFVRIAGEKADGTYATFHGPPPEDFPGGREFLYEYDSVGFREPPEAYGIFAYAAMQTVLSALTRSSGTREAVRNALRDSLFETVVGTVKFDANGQSNLHVMAVYKVVSSKWVPVYETDASGRLLPVASK